MAFQPSAPYRHDGQTLHPKLTYTLPAGMEAALVSMGFGASVDGPADLDLSHLTWDAATVPYQGTVAPASVESI